MYCKRQYILNFCLTNVFATKYGIIKTLKEKGSDILNLEVKHLKKVYTNGENETQALRDVSFSVEQGEFVCIMGSSGSGKTSLLNIIGALDVSTEGKIWINGISITDMESEDRTVFRRRNIGFVFQQYNLVSMINVYENIVLPLRLDGASVDEAFFKELTVLLKIEEKLDKLPETLSGGQQQRVAIARALVTKPALILADEPTGSLDSTTSMEVVRLLKTCAKRFSQTIIMVSHDWEVAKQADRIIRIEDGEIADWEK